MGGNAALNWEDLLSCIELAGTPKCVHFMEFFIDPEMQQRICREFGLLEGLSEDDPFFEGKMQIRLQRFLGYAYVRCSYVDGLEMPSKGKIVDDTAELRRPTGRRFAEEHEGPITDWQSFESYPWPDPGKAGSKLMEWYEDNLPGDMCILGLGGFGHFFEHLMWLMGYESLCFALYDRRDLVKAIVARLLDLYVSVLTGILSFNRVKILVGSDDMGFRSSTMIGPDDLREFVLPGHRRMAELCHQAGKPYLLHSCGNLEAIMEDLIAGVKIDGKHSFEDTIMDVRDAKDHYGDRIALIGGIDVDFLCRASERDIRKRVRETLEHCMAGGGYCLGTGNSVANYIPMENYLAMLDEGRRFVP